jgi:flagellin
MRITINTSANSAARHFGATVSRLDDNVARLSSGTRIARATDDAAGLVVSNRLRAQVTGLRQAMRNAQDGLAVAQIVDDALGQLSDLLQRMRDLTVQAANTGVNDIAARAGIEREMAGLVAEGQRVIDQTTFGSQPLFAPSTSSWVNFQVGAGATGNDRYEWQVTPMSWDALSSPAIDSASFDPELTMQELDLKYEALYKRQFETAAMTKRFETVVASLQTTSENLAVAESRLRDTDMATEMVDFTRSRVMRDASSAMLAQANRIHGNMLGLLQS